MNPDDAEEAIARSLNKIPVSGQCDAGCGQPATTWFGLTSCATCGSELCIARLQRDYDAMDRPARAPDHPAVERRLRGTVPVTGNITDSGRLLPLSVPPGFAVALWPNDIAEHVAHQLALIQRQAKTMEAQDTLVAATLEFGEIRGRVLAMRDVGMLTDEVAEGLIESIKRRYTAQWEGVLDTAMEPDR
jgi:hypothetical protein